MAAIPLHYIDLRTFCYVTEDDKRVEAAIRRFLPEDFELERHESEGHHGDRILVFNARVETADDIRAVLETLGDLPSGAIETVEDQLDERVDDNCSFFLTLDKQAAYNGRIELGDGITLRAKVEAYPAKKAHAIDAMEAVLDEVN